MQTQPTTQSFEAPIPSLITSQRRDPQTESLLLRMFVKQAFLLAEEGDRLESPSVATH